MVLSLTSKKRFDASNLQPLFILYSAGVSTLSALGVLLLALAFFGMATRTQPTLVQLSEGKSVLAQQFSATERTPDSIRNFVKGSLGLMFTWNANLSLAESGEDSFATGESVVDTGIPMPEGRITSASWQASFALKEDFRTTFLEQVAQLTPPDVFSGNAQSVLSFDHISDPQLLESGYWQVDVVANLIVIDNAHPAGITIPFNKSVYVRAVEPTVDLLPEETTPLQKAVYQLKESGLQIDEIRDLQR